MTDRPDLADLLDRAVPDPPPLAGLAARAEADARRARTRRRTAVGAAALVVVGASVSLVTGSRPSDPVAGDRVDPAPDSAAPCRRDTSSQVTEVAPVSIRFCPVPDDGAPPPALVPQVALTTDVEGTIRELDQAIRRQSEQNPVCVPTRNPSRVQVGYADGRVVDLPVTPCNGVYPILLEAIGRQQAAPVADLDAPALQCPPHPAARLLSAVSHDEPAAVRSLAASSALRCDFEAGRPIDSERLTGADAEALRATLLSSYSRAKVDCGAGPDAPVHTWVLRLADASVHTATVDDTRCGELRIDGHYLGLAGRALRDLIDG